MSKPQNLVVSALVCAALAACTEGPTLAPDIHAPAGPTLYGGPMLGLGGQTAQPDNTPAVLSTETTAGDSTAVTEGRGGHTLGSGH